MVIFRRVPFSHAAVQAGTVYAQSRTTVVVLVVVAVVRSSVAVVTVVAGVGLHISSVSRQSPSSSTLLQYPFLLLQGPVPPTQPLQNARLHWALPSHKASCTTHAHTRAPPVKVHPTWALPLTDVQHPVFLNAFVATVAASFLIRTDRSLKHPLKASRLTRETAFGNVTDVNAHRSKALSPIVATCDPSGSGRDFSDEQSWKAWFPSAFSIGLDSNVPTEMRDEQPLNTALSKTTTELLELSGAGATSTETNDVQNSNALASRVVTVLGIQTDSSDVHL